MPLHDNAFPVVGITIVQPPCSLPILEQTLSLSPHPRANSLEVKEQLAERARCPRHQWSTEKRNRERYPKEAKDCEIASRLMIPWRTGGK
eukprot:759747-Hanusia_phi.AAC.4